MNDSLRVRPSQIFGMAVEGYRHELRALTRLVKSPYFLQLVPWFSQYPLFLERGASCYLGENSLDKLFKSDGILDASVDDPLLERLFAAINLAASCSIFGGWTIPVSELDETRVNEYLSMALASNPESRETLGQSMAERLNKGDAMRIVQLLRLLGLLKTKSSSCHHLAIGASVGLRDRLATHESPALQPVALPPAISPLRFGVKLEAPASVVLVDNDPVMAPLYRQINKEKTINGVSAMNQDLYHAVEMLSGSIECGYRHACSLVTAFRIEPRAFPDTVRFLDAIGSVIAAEADLVMTMGSGDNVAQFKHRLQVLDSISGELEARGMRPLRMKFHVDGSLQEQWIGSVFGMSHYASHQALYCRLNREALRQD